MPDEAKVESRIEDVQDDLAEAKDDLKDARTPAQKSAVEVRIDGLESKLHELQTAFADLTASHEGKAEKAHEHPLPAELRSLHEHLSSIEAEEQAPRREHWFNRRIGR